MTEKHIYLCTYLPDWSDMTLNWQYETSDVNYIHAKW